MDGLIAGSRGGKTTSNIQGWTGLSLAVEVEDGKTTSKDGSRGGKASKDGETTSKDAWAYR